MSRGFSVWGSADAACPTTRVAKGYWRGEPFLPGMGRFGMDDELDAHPLVLWQIVDELAARSATVRAIVVVLTANL